MAILIFKILHLPFNINLCPVSNSFFVLACRQGRNLGRGRGALRARVPSCISYFGTKGTFYTETKAMYRVFIKYCVFSEFLKIFRSLFLLGVSVCTHTRQVENPRCSRIGRVQKSHKILRKNYNF